MMPPRALVLAAARKAIAEPPGNAGIVRALAQQCRMLGALDEARILAAQAAVLTGDPEAALLADILSERPSRIVSGAAPVPFVRVRSFLPDEVHAAIKSMTRYALPHFAASTVHEDGHGKLDVSQRVSAILRDPADFRTLFLPYQQAAMRERGIGTIIGTGYGAEALQELQVTCSGDGAFFKPHTDSGRSTNKGRRITFVYYYELAPASFSGGSLLLFDASQDEQRYASGSFTRIEPEDNSIVFFPSSAVHEVEPVRAVSAALEHGRFTINGWLH
jgi:hypothetical protein